MAQVNQKQRVIYPVDGFSAPYPLVEHLRGLFMDQAVRELIGMIKVNDAVFFPGLGPTILRELHDVIRPYGEDIGIFLDLKLADVGATNRNILGRFLPWFEWIRMLTVRSQISEASPRDIHEFFQLFPATTIAVVALPTDISEEECLRRYGMNPYDYICREICSLEGVWGCIGAVVCSPWEVAALRKKFPQFQYVVPGIRDEWMAKDHQQRIAGVYDTLAAGADWLVMGAQLSKGNPEAKEPTSAEESRRKTLAEIGRFFAEKEGIPHAA